MEIIARYRRKQFIILSVIFQICASVIFIAEYRREKKILLSGLNSQLNGYSELMNNYLTLHGHTDLISKISIDSMVKIIPDSNIRVTIIDLGGNVKYDSRVKNIDSMQNHLDRPEIESSLKKQTGSDIRVSATDHLRYYYFAKKYQDFFIRISVEYNIDTASLVEPEKFPIFLTLLIFFVATILIVFVTDKFGTSLSMLKRFTLQATGNHDSEGNIKFPKNELGNIGKDIVDIYDKLNKAKAELISEKEKLIRHLNLLDEGIAIFTKDKQIIANNSSFIQYLSLISDKQVISPDNFFEIEDFSSLFKFIDSQLNQEKENQQKQSFYEININLDSRTFSAKSIVFPDNSIEIIIDDVTKMAKRKILKQQLTDNISHELKTPVSSIKGFLETILEIQPEKEKLYYFIQKAYSQTCRLAELINDISLLTKIEEAGNLYHIEKINVYQAIQNVADDVDLQLKENKINLQINISEHLEFEGNPILIYSIFRNLFDNSIRYAGNDLTIKVEKYLEDEDFYYFSYSDNGTGVPEHDLPRLFERFYRVDKGRDHKKGGTGLGLAIVKNAILFHKGEISVKNRKEGGLEFLFSFKKSLE